MSETHRTRQLRIAATPSPSEGDRWEFVGPDGETFGVDGRLFDLLFEELPQVSGAIRYSCGCPHKDDIDVEREWIMIAADEGLSLRKAADRFGPKQHPDRFEAFATAAMQMVREGFLDRSPFH